MSLVTTLWAMEAAAALTLGVLYGVVWGIDRRNLANLTLCILAVAMVGVARAEVGMMHAATVQCRRNEDHVDKLWDPP